jgi:uncharacterized membrane protein
MSWFFLALLSAVLFAWITIIDKEMVDQNFTDPFMYSLFIRIYGVISATIFVLVADDWQFSSITAIGTAFIAGSLQVSSGIIYFSSLTRADASLVSAAEQTRPLFATIWGIWLLGEHLGSLGYLGVSLIVLGTILLTRERHDGESDRGQLTQIVIFMLLANVFRTMADLLMKISLRENTPEQGYFWQAIGALILAGAILGLWPRGRIRMKVMLMTANRRSFSASILNEFTANLAGLILTTALASGILAGVSTLNATQPLFIVPLVGLANWVRPGSVAKEDQNNGYVPRWTISIVIVIGISLLQYAT